MILPIYAYGQPVLKKQAQSIDQNYPELATLIQNMWDTMYNAKGVGLAAPQIGLGIRLFIVDTIQIESEEKKDFKGIKKVLINAELIDENGNLWPYEEGCLSIPNINGDVERFENLRIKYFDENFVEHMEAYDGMNARVIQHEYDHIEGILFTEKLSPLKKKLISRKLDKIKAGSNNNASYKLKFV